MTDIRGMLQERIEYWQDEIKDEDVFDFSKYDLRELLTKEDSFSLFRYMPANYYNIRNIETQTIHLSENGVLNDVYEGIPSTEMDLSYGEIQKLHDLAVMTCFSESNDNMLMWSHYADSHKGFCVEYNLKILKEDPYELLKHLFPVIYEKKRLVKKNIKELIDRHVGLNEAIDGDYVYDEADLLDDILPLFITKGCIWDYEKEWRIIYTRKQLYDYNDKILYNGNLSFKCISAVYLGYRIHPEKRRHIMEICQRISSEDQTVQVYQAKLDKEGYEIHYEKV